MDEEYFRALRQGYVLTHLDASSEFVVIVSQSCDVVQPKREFLQIAPLVGIDDATVRRGALSKENPRFPLVSKEMGGLFADLARIQSHEKTEVQGTEVRADLSLIEDVRAREFALAVGRWFGRFAVPDDVQPWLLPAQELIRSKHDNAESALGRVLHMVAETRVEADDWSATPLNLTLHVILRAGDLPSIPDDADFSISRSIPKDLNGVCEQILRESEPIRLNVLWATFAEYIAARCRPKVRFNDVSSVMNSVASVTGEISTDDEFPLSRVRRSEQLDVDFLSSPVPY